MNFLPFRSWGCWAGVSFLLAGLCNCAWTDFGDFGLNATTENREGPDGGDSLRDDGPARDSPRSDTPPKGFAECQAQFENCPCSGMNCPFQCWPAFESCLGLGGGACIAQEEKCFQRYSKNDCDFFHGMCKERCHQTAQVCEQNHWTDVVARAECWADFELCFTGEALDCLGKDRVCRAICELPACQECDQGLQACQGGPKPSCEETYQKCLVECGDSERCKATCWAVHEACK